MSSISSECKIIKIESLQKRLLLFNVLYLSCRLYSISCDILWINYIKSVTDKIKIAQLFCSYVEVLSKLVYTGVSKLPYKRIFDCIQCHFQRHHLA